VACAVKNEVAYDNAKPIVKPTARLKEILFVWKICTNCI